MCVDPILLHIQYVTVGNDPIANLTSKRKNKCILVKRYINNYVIEVLTVRHKFMCIISIMVWFYPSYLYFHITLAM